MAAIKRSASRRSLPQRTTAWPTREGCVTPPHGGLAGPDLVRAGVDGGTVSPSRTTTSPNSARFSSSTGTRNARDVGAGHALGAQGANTSGRICDGVSDHEHEQAAGRQNTGTGRRNRPERGCRPDGRGRADPGDIRAVQNGHQIGWWAPNPGQPRGGVEGYTEGHGTPAGADFRYLLEQLGANPRDGARRSLPPTIGTTVYAEP